MLERILTATDFSPAGAQPRHASYGGGTPEHMPSAPVAPPGATPPPRVE